MPEVKKRKYRADTVRAAFSAYAVGEESQDGEQRLFCPICEDPNSSNSPSAMMNAESGLWNCLKGNHGGTIVALVQDLKRERNWDIRAESMKGRHADPDYHAAAQERLTGRKSGAPLPDDDQISKWTEALLANKTKLKALTDARGFDKATIISWELGWDGQRYTIPIRDENGDLVNVRRYMLNASSHADKMLNLPGHGSAVIYRPDILQANEEIVITEGETDCILLNQEGIPAVATTAGAGTFRPAWANMFRDKVVWVAYDADDAGRKGAKKVENTLQAFAKAVYIIAVPETKKSADITDYLYLEGHTANDFRGLMMAAQDSKGISSWRTAPIAIAGEHVSLNESMAQDNQSKTIELVVSIAGKQQEPYTAPRLITATCDQSKGAACTLCPIAARNGQAEFEMRKDDEQLFRFIDVGEDKRKALMKEITGARCSDRVEFDVEENYHVEELLVQPSVDDRIDGESQQPIKRTAFSISTYSTEVNKKVRLVGKNVPDPKSGKLRFMSWVNEPVEMDIDKFVLDEEMRTRLSVFKPAEGQSALQKSLEIANDMAHNVTHIYGRDLLHVGYDLVWHSVLSFRVGDVALPKGWLEMVAVGDTRTGKSEVAVKLQKHYRSGVVQSCEGMSFAGLVGGVQQIDGRWHMSWGVVPMNDRRLLVLDEMSGLKEKDVIEQMSSIRSSGIAQITKIAAEETSARTRIIWITNPADGSMLKDNPTGGMGALRTMVPNAEDIARFDFAMATRKDDVSSEIINRPPTEYHQPTYSSEDSESLIKWVWSLTRDDVIISEGAVKAASKGAIELGSRYVSDPPLIQSENVRYKLLRIAAALAARTFSISARGKLIVSSEHVSDAIDFLDLVYEEDAMGYARMSRRSIQGAERAQQKRQLCIEYLREHEHDVFLTLRMVGGNNFRTRDFVDYGAMDPVAAREVVKTLLNWNVIRMKTRGDIGMEPVLISAIRELEDEN